MTDNARIEAVTKGIHDVALRTMPAGSRVLLYGSRARGDYREDSDWDVLLLVNKQEIEQSDYQSIVYPMTVLGWDMNEMIIPIIKTRKEWDEDPYSMFHYNVEQEAIPIL